MKSFVLIIASLFCLTMTQTFDQKREEIVYKFCEDVWLSQKSDDQIIQQYLVENKNKDVSDSKRSSLIKLYLDNLREIKPAGSLSDIKVKPYVQITPIPGLEPGSDSKNIYAITAHNKVLFYTLFESDRIAAFTMITKGGKSYFLKF
jgi:hypothetical protein